MIKTAIATTMRAKSANRSFWLSRPVEETPGGVPLSLIAIADFRANKRATGRLKDLADLEALEDPDEG